MKNLKRLYPSFLAIIILFTTQSECSREGESRWPGSLTYVVVSAAGAAAGAYGVWRFYFRSRINRILAIQEEQGRALVEMRTTLLGRCDHLDSAVAATDEHVVGNRSFFEEQIGLLSDSVDGVDSKVEACKDDLVYIRGGIDRLLLGQKGISAGVSGGFSSLGARLKSRGLLDLLPEAALEADGHFHTGEASEEDSFEK